jgi:hypothetical protein
MQLPRKLASTDDEDVVPTTLWFTLKNPPPSLTRHLLPEGGGELCGRELSVSLFSPPRSKNGGG